MVYAFDTLGYAQRLRAGGVPQDQAEAHATAARDFVMGELVTKADLNQALQVLDREHRLIRQDIEAQTLRLTIRLGVLMAAGIAILGAVIKLT